MSEQVLSAAGVNPKVTKLVYNSTGAALEAKTPGFLADGAYGRQYIALVDDTNVHKFCVTATDIDAGKWGQVVVEGECLCTVPSATYTSGHAFKVHNGAVGTMSATPSAAGVCGDAGNEFGVIKTGGTTVTEVTLVLNGNYATGTT